MILLLSHLAIAQQIILSFGPEQVILLIYTMSGSYVH